LRAEELWRGDADDRERAPLHLEQAPDNARIAAEPPLPIAMADHRHGFAIPLGQRPAQDRVDAEHGVVITRDQLRQRELRFTVDTDMRVQERTEGRESRKHGAVRGEIRGGGGREREDVAARAALTKHDEVARVADGKRPQEHRVGQGEDRCVRADAERQRQHRDRGEHRIAAQGTNAVTQVARQIVEPRQTALVAHRLHRLRHTTGPDRRRSPGALDGVCAPALVLGGELQMQPQFCLEFGIPTARTHRSPQTRHPLAECGHRASQSGLTGATPARLSVSLPNGVSFVLLACQMVVRGAAVRFVPRALAVCRRRHS
jgi:hypothetical protein